MADLFFCNYCNIILIFVCKSVILYWSYIVIYSTFTECEWVWVFTTLPCAFYNYFLNLSIYSNNYLLYPYFCYTFFLDCVVISDALCANLKVDSVY